METPKELLDYVALAKKAGVADSFIRAELEKAGWENAVIDSVLPIVQLASTSSVTPTVVQTKIVEPVVSNFDPTNKVSLKKADISAVVIKQESPVLPVNQTSWIKPVATAPKRGISYLFIVYILLLGGVCAAFFFYFPKIKSMFVPKTTLQIDEPEVKVDEVLVQDNVDKEKIVAVYTELQSVLASSTTLEMLASVNMLPVDRAVESIDTNSYTTTRALGYQFATPWGKGWETEKTKKSLDMMEIAYPNGKNVLLYCSNRIPHDEFVGFSDLQSDELKSLLDYFGSKADSGYEFYNTIVSVKPDDVLSSQTVEQANIIMKLVRIKRLNLSTIGKQLYRFATPNIKGFQAGDYSASQSTFVDIFPDNATHCTLTATEKSNLSQKEVDTILSTFQKQINQQQDTIKPAQPKGSASTGEKITASEAWKVFDQYVLAIKNQSIDSLNQVSYDNTHSCPSGSEEECKAMFVFIYDSIKNLERSKYINAVSDSRQIILSTDLVYTPASGDNSFARYEKGYIFIARDGGGILKIVSVNPNRGWNVNTKGSSTYKQTLDEMVVDSDSDGLTDQNETCSGAKQYDSKCKKTDPKKMDTDGNGVWDGFEA